MESAGDCCCGELWQSHGIGFVMSVVLFPLSCVFTATAEFVCGRIAQFDSSLEKLSGRPGSGYV